MKTFGHEPALLSPLEKVLLLRDAKMLRFVPERFLATLADVADVETYAPRRAIAVAGDEQGRNRVIQRHFNMSVLEAMPASKASTLRARPES